MRLGAVLLAGSLGCAHVYDFDATPRNACAGDPVTVTWKADGKVSLDAQPPVPGIGPKADQGSESFVIARDTRFVLHARALLSSAHAEKDIVVAPPTLEYGTFADCSSDSRAIVSSFEVKEVSPAVKLKGVVNVNARDIAIQPEGAGTPEVAVPASGRSESFQGQRAGGRWTVKSALGPGETCQDALRRVARKLVMKLEIDCGR